MEIAAARATKALLQLGLSLTLVVPAPALAHGPGAFQVVNPRVRVEAGNARVYVSLENKEGKSVKIVGALSPVAERTELRRGQRPVAHFDIPAKGTLKLSPSGDSIALLGLTRVLRAGDLVPVILRLGDGDTFAVMARVEATGAARPTP